MHVQRADRTTELIYDLITIATMVSVQCIEDLTIRPIVSLNRKDRKITEEYNRKN